MLILELVDEDTKAEFEEMQKQGITGRGSSGNPAESIQNFDFASWMAGKSTGSSAASNEEDSRKRR